MHYEDALRHWGANKLYCHTCHTTGTARLDSITVEFDFNEGFACCGGTNPDCYCSFAESPRADIRITGQCGAHKNGQLLTYTRDANDFNFTTVLEEIVAAGNGTITT